ncbi:DUF1206 domain-containing protein [Pseudooceanicola sp.]|uniref:DUF1206 domain-containing protein n=1 Tax=Pseudooceanicola sp. TaxID=1914328 RepID=UPI000C08DDE9|nr:hypothetical protein [Pseudooceanicola sp.]
MSDDRAPAWVVPVMRTGYSARGFVYIVLGILTILAAWTGSEAEGTRQSLENLRSFPGGSLMLWGVAIGLLAYCVWRLIDAFMDLEDYGHAPKGVIARGGQVVTGLLHGYLAFSAGRLALGQRESGEGGGSSGHSAASWVLQQPYGKFVIGAIGLVTIGAGVYYCYKAYSEKYKEHLRCTATSERLDPLIKTGLVAHGIVIALIGAFLLYAGITADSSQVGGIGKAFQTVRSQPFGQILLGGMGLGMLCFALYCVVEAIYRVLPSRAGPDVQTLASAAKREAKQAVNAH